MNEKENLIVNTLRVLSADGIEKAKSGHPGLPLGSAPIAYKVFADHLKFNPKNPKFVDRDRFILSAGHGSMLLYSLLHVCGYDISKEDLMNFRQLNSKTPGHPEFGGVGVEVSTGPLGQGVANGVGFALAERFLASKFNRPNYEVVDHYTYVLTGDGCMQEGIEYEAASFAGTNKLSKLIVIYDKNDITIEGDIDCTFTEDVAKRHRAQGWDVKVVEDANDIETLGAAIVLAKAEKEKPSLIIVKSQIGYGSPKQNSASCHGAPLGQDCIDKLRENLGYDVPAFETPKEIKEFTKECIEKGKQTEDAWNKLYNEYKKVYPDVAEEYEKFLSGDFGDVEKIAGLFEDNGKEATRVSSYKILNKIAKTVPNLIGGAADLGPSTKSVLDKKEYFSANNYLGQNIHFGIREHAMSAICNGIYLHGGLRPFCSTFFVFTDYMKNAMRMSALMNIPVIYILTHDSIGVGEDGATHQPVEQLIGLRSIPNMKVYRPADSKETAAAWVSAMKGTQPTCIVLSRQDLPTYESTGKGALKGGYVLFDSEKETPDVILIATGSELQLAVNAKEDLKKQGVDARVVSMPSIEVFEKQTEKYKESVLPKAVRARVAIEAGSSYSWYKYVGIDGETVCMDTFGQSAPANELFNLYGFTTKNVVKKALASVKKCKK